MTEALLLALSLFATSAETTTTTDTQVADAILEKLVYDQQYFSKLIKLDDQGRTSPGMTKGTFAKELQRARQQIAVLERFSKERDAYKSGAAFSYPQSAAAHVTYTNLLAMLNMLQAHARADWKAVTEHGARVHVDDKEDLGRVRGSTPGYYVDLYRRLYFLMASAHHHLGDDTKALEWFARLEADADLKALKERMEQKDDDAAPDEGARRAALRMKAVALTPFENLDKQPKHDWVKSALLETLTNDLAATTDLLLVERASLDNVMDEVALKLSGFTGGTAAGEVGAMLEASSLLVGSYRAVGESYELRLRLVDTEAGTILAGRERTAGADELFVAARELALEVFDAVGWGDVALRDELLARPLPTAGTAKMLHEARLLLATQADQARALFAKAAREDPALANLYEDLKAEFKDVSATMAVLPFLNVTGRDDDAWMAHGVMEALSTDLPKLGFTTVERAALDRVLEEQVAISERASATNADAQQIGGALGADFVVVGSVLRQSPNLRVDARFVDVRTGVIAFSTSVEDHSDDLARVLVKLQTAMAERFNQPLDEDTLDSLMAKKMSSEDFEKYSRAQLAQQRLRAERSAETPSTESDDAPAWRPIAFWTAAGGTAAGAAVAITAFALAQPFASQAYTLDGMRSLALNEAARDDLGAQRDDAALMANISTGVGVAGVVMSGVSLAVLLGVSAIEQLESE